VSELDVMATLTLMVGLLWAVVLLASLARRLAVLPRAPADALERSLEKRRQRLESKLTHGPGAVATATAGSGAR
jgi:hypothetical protein